jgi:hypothetical protein
MWMYDQPNLGGRRLCFSAPSGKQDWVDYTLIVRYVLSGIPFFWGGAVRSAWAGSTGGYFRTLDAIPAVATFGPYQQFTTAPTAMANARLLYEATSGTTQSANFVLDYHDPIHTECDSRTAAASFGVDDGTTIYIDDHVTISQLGSDGGSGVLCRAMHDFWNMPPGMSYRVTMSAFATTGLCRLWTLEGQLYAEANGRKWSSPIDLGICRTLGN